MWVRSLGREDPLEKVMATHSSILAWRIPQTEEPSGLQSIKEGVFFVVVVVFCFMYLKETVEIISVNIRNTPFLIYYF